MADTKEKPMVIKPVKPIKPTMDEEDYGPTPPDIKDKLQTMKNQKAAEQYEKTKRFAKGGSASSRADGCAQRGKTRGKMV
jgi:hypothetical protein